ncbi:conserved hypothetical protein [Sphingobacterium sp. PM2-P1-29]|nr:conserved hypothetical protein [Sphingobacterium sp. PM2-P1-29]
MDSIKTLADELRETIRNDNKPVNRSPKSNTSSKSAKTDKKIDPLFEEILGHKLIGKEKLLIRLDDRTIFFLKQLKVSKGIDMNKIISFSLQYFLKNHPQIANYIKDSLKNIDL